jgi:hypothetical protein
MRSFEIHGGGQEPRAFPKLLVSRVLGWLIGTCSCGIKPKLIVSVQIKTAPETNGFKTA